MVPAGRSGGPVGEHPVERRVPADMQATAGRVQPARTRQAAVGGAADRERAVGIGGAGDIAGTVGTGGAGGIDGPASGDPVTGEPFTSDPVSGDPVTGGGSAAGADRAALVASVGEELADLECRRYTDPRGIGGRARAVITVARANGLAAERSRARLIVADQASRSEDLAGAMDTARTILLQAQSRGQKTVAARSEAVIAWCLWRMGAIGDALAHAVEAVRLLPPDAPPHLAVDHRMVLAMLGAMQSRDDGYIAEFDAVLAAAEEVRRPHLLLAVLNNYAWTHWDHGHADAALPLVDRLEALAESGGIPLNSTILDTVASVLLDTGDLERAEDVAVTMVDPAVAEAEVRATPEALLTLARIRHRRGHPRQALDLVLQAERIAAQRGLPEITATATMDKALLLAEIGDHRGAYESLLFSHRTWVRVRDREAEARAVSLHALFETEQAHQRSQIFQELAERDALTGLWNRRHLDRVLPGLLVDHQVGGRVLSVAIVDVDHFKVINDERNHLTGDAVLNRIGDVLRRLVPEPAFTARLGGEEFVIVLPDTDPVAAYAVCEQTRLLLWQQRWDAITDGLPVTVSIGFATSGPEATVSRILNAADEALYRAKRGGRDQVQPVPDTAEGDRRRSRPANTQR